MKIIVNGDKKEVVNSITIDKIITDYGINKNNCIIELNGNALEKELFSKLLKEGDQLELIRFIGGG